jgi:hypothetical protein
MGWATGMGPEIYFREGLLGRKATNAQIMSRVKIFLLAHGVT